MGAIALGRHQVALFVATFGGLEYSDPTIDKLNSFEGPGFLTGAAVLNLNLSLARAFRQRELPLC